MIDSRRTNVKCGDDEENWVEDGASVLQLVVDDGEDDDDGGEDEEGDGRVVDLVPLGIGGDAGSGLPSLGRHGRGRRPGPTARVTSLRAQQGV